MNDFISNKIEPFVSVVVITYNSFATVIETLDSIKAQTYKNIELIITDDKSTDDTVQVCETWLEKNSSRFVHTEIVTTEINTGVSGNLNRGVRASKGEWIKSIAGDDLLIPTAIEEYVKFVKGHTEDVKMCVSDVDFFSSGNQIPQLTIQLWTRCIHYAQETYPQQSRRILRESVFVGPTYFYKRQLFDAVGGFSEEYGCCEEWPFVYKILNVGVRIYAIDKKLVLYRVSDNSLSNAKGLGNYRLFQSTYKFVFDYPLKDLLNKHQYFSAWDLFIRYKIQDLRFRTHNSRWVDLIKIIAYMVNPHAYIRNIRKMVYQYY